MNQIDLMGGDVNGMIPKYHMIKMAVLNRIKSREFVPGDLLPSEKELMEQYGASRITIRKALDELAYENFITKQQGKGTYVKDYMEPGVITSKNLYSCSELILHQNMKPTRTLVKKEVIPCDDARAKIFQIKPGDPVLLFERIYNADGIPAIFGSSVMNHKLIPGLENYDIVNNSFVQIITDIYKLPISKSQRVLKAISAEGNTAKYLNVITGFPLLHLSFNTNFERDGRLIPFEIASLCYRTDIIHFMPDIY